MAIPASTALREKPAFSHTAANERSPATHDDRGLVEAKRSFNRRNLGCDVIVLLSVQWQDNSKFPQCFHEKREAPRKKLGPAIARQALQLMKIPGSPGKPEVNS